jgi:hypothetical protein
MLSTSLIKSLAIRIFSFAEIFSGILIACPVKTKTPAAAKYISDKSINPIEGAIPI